MKKFPVFIIFLLISSLILTSLNLALAQTTPEDVFQQQTGISPENIPKSPEEIKELYLRQEWSNFIAKIPIIGSIHNFFLTHPLPFKILFAYPYEISLTFFLIFILWIFLVAGAADIINASGFTKNPISFLIGLAFSVILSQIGALKGIVLFTLNIIYAKETWWIRLILWLTFFVMLVVIFYFEKILGQQIRKGIKARKERELKEEEEEHEEYIKGAEEGRKIKEKYKVT